MAVLNGVLVQLNLAHHQQGQPAFTNRDLKDFHGRLLRDAEDRDYEEAVRACDSNSNNNPYNNVDVLKTGLEVATPTPCSEPGSRRFWVPRGFGKAEAERGAIVAADGDGDGDGDVRCFRTGLAFGRQLSRLEATFSSTASGVVRVPQGPARAEYGTGEDGTTVIVMHAVIREGFVHGPVLFADAAGLLSFGRVLNGAVVGGAWGRQRTGGRRQFIFSKTMGSRATSYGDFEAFVVEADGGGGGGGESFYRGTFLEKAQVLTDVSLDQGDFRPVDGCFVDFDPLPPLPGSDLVYSLEGRRLHSTAALMETCNGFGRSQKSGREALRWINGTYFSLDRDTLLNFSPFPEATDGQPLFSGLRRSDDGNYTISVGGELLRATVRASHLDEEGLPQGQGQVSLLDESPLLPLPGGRFRPIAFEGIFAGGGVAEGAVLVPAADGRFINLRARGGVMHGPAVGLGLGHLSTPERELTRRAGYGVPGVGWLGVLRGGRAEGAVWAGMVGGGFLHGRVDAEGQLTGDDVAFVYPDGETALVGSFERGVMREAREATVTSVECDRGGIPKINYEFAPGEEASLFSYDPPSNDSFGQSPLLRDPLDKKNVEVRRSGIPGGGEGLFALRPLASDDVITYYSAMRYTREQHRIYQSLCHEDEARSDDERRRCATYTVAVESAEDTVLDLPPWSVRRFAATSGHKANCAIGDEANALFVEAEHPRFGLVLQVVAKRDIAEGEEVLVDYGYKGAPFPADHLWYHEAKRKYMQKKSSQFTLK